ncbi:MAG: hypothetical protein WCL04_10790, partial [Verrucomicrobiota bacterium]
RQTYLPSQRGGRGEGLIPDELMQESIQVQDEVIYQVSYAGYLAREKRQIDKFSDLEIINLPSNLNYLEIKGLRKESALKLAEFQPVTLGQASRLSGVNPSDISVLMIFIRTAKAEPQKGSDGEGRVRTQSGMDRTAL